MTKEISMSQKLFLLDGMAMVYRSYFALLQSNLKSSQGEPTGAVYGFTATLIKLMEDYKPDHIAVVFDTAAPTFRHIKYEQYKAQRPPMPDDMKPQISYIKKIIRGYDIPVLEIDGFEADDVIGTLAKKAEKDGVNVVMVTPDKDYMQLITENIWMLRPTSKSESGFEVIEFAGVQEKFGVGPDRVIDVLGLMGDTADNVPGVPGIGEKTAIKIIQEYGTMEAAIAAAKIKPTNKTHAKLAEFEQQALASKDLVTIDINSPIELDWETLKITTPHYDQLVELFTHLNFRSFKNKLEASTKAAGTADNLFAELPPEQQGSTSRSIDKFPHEYKTITSQSELVDYLKTRKPENPLCFDLETTSVDAMMALPIGVALSHEKATGIYLPINVDSESDITEKLGWVKPYLTDSEIPKIAQNAKYDMLILKRYGIDVTPVIFDTMVAAFVINSAQPVGMDDLSEKYLGYTPIPISDLIGTGKNQKNMKDIPVETVSEYAAEDADITLQLFEKLNPELKETDGEKYCAEIEFPLIEVLTDLEFNGIRVDKQFLANLSGEMTATLLNLQGEIWKHAETNFNINSTKQLSEILFEKLGLPTMKKTKTGYSTDVSVLESLRFAHPIIENLLNYRQLEKLRSTYIDALPEMIHPITGRVHSTFSQTVAATGRLSSNNPNLQNIPVRSDMGREIRKAFIPADDDHVLISADYSQIELRIVASVAKDANMIETFKHGADIHTDTAARVFDVAPDQVTRDMRRKAKEVNFGIIYGISAFGLSSRLGIPQGEAKDIIQRYFTTYPGIKQYMADIVFKAKMDGYVSTLKGRRRYIPDINNSNHNVRQFAERVAINSPIQGSAADMIKIAMINIHSWLKTSDLKTKMILQVHDELIFDVPKNEVEIVRPKIIDLMQNALPLEVPVLVEAGVGNNWLDAH